MRLINYTTPRLLVADEGKHIRDKNDVYIAEHKNDEGDLVPEHVPYFSTVIFPGAQIQTIEQAQELYTEEEIEVGG